MLFSLTDRHKPLEPEDSGRLHAMEAEVEEVPFDLPSISPRFILNAHLGFSSLKEVPQTAGNLRYTRRLEKAIRTSSFF